MNRARVKARWQNWENQCIKQAFEMKIQHKIIAVALEKSVSSINKKINKLGLRETIHKSGRIKGQKCHLRLIEKTPQDVEVMTKIMQSFAPLEIFQKRKMNLQERFWTSANPLDKKKREKGPCVGSLKETNVTFSLTPPLHYILTKPEKQNTTRIERIVGEPFYVPYEHVAHWAISSGFKLLKENLPEKGLAFWKDGQYFSRTQVLMHVNKIRQEKRLKPLFYEEDMDLNREKNQDLKRKPHECYKSTYPLCHPISFLSCKEDWYPDRVENQQYDI